MGTINNDLSDTFDVIIVGAGFSGLYMLYQLRKKGYSVKVLEAGDGVGGTWYWNRYPGARCDVDSLQYSYSFSEELQNEWKWSELYASQPEILRYLNYVADKFDLRKDIQLQTRVTSAMFDENHSNWEIHTHSGHRLFAKFCIMATGCLSAAKIPDIQGLNNFKGHYYHTGRWPHEVVNFSGRRVAVIGTGSSGVQSIPIIAEQASHVFVLQRTPNFSIPSRNRPLTSEDQELWRLNYPEYRRNVLDSFAGFLSRGMKECKGRDLTHEEMLKKCEECWQAGGLDSLLIFTDLFVDKETNDIVAEFVRNKIRDVVKDPIVAESLVPYRYPIATKRLCVDTNYFQTFNRDNVTLVDLSKGSIDEITETGIRIKDKVYEVDDILFATGFDAMTGALLNMDIHGRSNTKLCEKWAEGPRTYLGIMIAGFPNLFTMTGPGSPSVLSNMIASIEQHADWIAECLDNMRTHNYKTIEPTLDAENLWTNHVNEVSKMTLYDVNQSWYSGANIEGKPRIFMPYVAGLHIYRQKCNEIVANGYQGFTFDEKAPALSQAN